MKEITLTVRAERPLTLQSFLMKQSGVSRRLLNKLKRLDSGITCNGAPIRSIDTVRDGDVIVLRTEDSGGGLVPNGSLDIPIVYENDCLAVFDKPAGVPVHPSAKHRDDTLGNWCAYLWPGQVFRPVSRLDKDTSGLCIAAKDAHSAQLLQGRCEKVYFAAVQGLTEEFGTVDAPIARQRESIILRCVREDGRPAVTHFRRLGYSPRTDCSLLELNLETGRTHQIRVHMAHIGHPLAGDDLYGGSRELIGRHALHCGKLSFTQPMTGERITLESALPEDMRRLFGE